MLYKKNLEKTLSKELFKNPTSEYRGTPFWAWNDYLTKQEEIKQCNDFVKAITENNKPVALLKLDNIIQSKIQRRIQDKKEAILASKKF